MLDWFKKNGREKEKALLEAVAGGIYLTDTEGAVVFMNKAAGELLGYAPEDVLGKSSHAVFHHTGFDGSPNSAETCPILEALRTGAVRKLTDEAFCARDGRRIHVDCTASPV